MLYEHIFVRMSKEKLMCLCLRKKLMCLCAYVLMCLCAYVLMSKK